MKPFLVSLGHHIVYSVNSCVSLLCTLVLSLCFQLKLRWRHTVGCWFYVLCELRLLHFVCMVWRLWLLSLQRCHRSYVFYFKKDTHMVLYPFGVLLSELAILNSGKWHPTPSLFCWFLLSRLLLSVSCSFILYDCVWFTLLNSLPSPPSLALLTNSQNPLHVEPAL